MGAPDGTGYAGVVDRPQPGNESPPSQAAEPPPVYLQARTEFAHRYLAGDGLEIGGLNLPLEVPKRARVRQVDRMTTDKLREAYPEMAERDLPEVEVIDDGETLATVPADSQDFIIANHFLEHTGDPIGTIGNHLGKLKPGGILFYAVPDKRYTFDFRRDVTPLEHMIRDHEEGADVSRRQHYDEWGLLVEGNEVERRETDWPAHAEAIARKLEAADYSIHTHVWTEATFLQLLLHCRERFDEGFEIEATCRRELEIVVVLRKVGAEPTPAAPPPTVPDLAAEVDRLGAQVAQLERELDQTGRELRHVKRSPSWRVTKPLRAAKARLGGRR